LASFAIVVAIVGATAAVFPVTAVAADPVIAAAGDIACDPASGSFNAGNGTATSCRQRYTSDQLVGAGLAAVLPLGDIQYDCGGAAAYLQSYDLSWGRVKSISHPVVGNHEYGTSSGTDCDGTGNAAGYFGYWGAAAGDPTKGYYSYNIGTWHLIALNSNCAKAGGCSAGSPQEQWLRQDLAAVAAAPTQCVLAYWHHPLFTSGEYSPGVTSVRPLFQALYDYNADVVLSGHDHNYERFAPQAPDGTYDGVRGIREFIVGTGGKSLYSPQTAIANSQVRSSSSYGVLKLTLHWSSYEWQFVPAAGSTFTDVGGEWCDKPVGQAYARPVSANAASVPLVPAQKPCSAANLTHAAPLTAPSCGPPLRSSPYVTVGTPDANGKAANFSGKILLNVLGERPINPNNGDQADVSISATLTDVRRATSPYADYTGQLQGQAVLRVTDRNNGAAGDESTTSTDVPFSFTIPCQTTADANIGSTCSVTTSADGVMAGVVKESKRAIWELVSVKVLDGGPDNIASTADNSVFATAGFFAP
jgi:acid phosphatase type 7